MTASTENTGAAAAPGRKGDRFGIARRRRSESYFKALGLLAITLAVSFLIFLLVSVVARGYTAFQQTNLQLEVELPQEVFDPQGNGTVEAIRQGNGDRLRFHKALREALYTKLGISDADTATKNAANQLISGSAPPQLRRTLEADPSLVGDRQTIWVLAEGNVDALLKGAISLEVPEENRQLSDQQVGFIQVMQDEGRLDKFFNTGLFTFGASSRAEAAGVGVAIVGSIYMILTVLLLALPIGVATSIYLEEFAPKNRITDLIEVNINNLAAVPSIVFGILGLAVFINFSGLPRSAAIVGGLVLTLMTLPTIIIATRASLKAVPPSIRQAALGVGASKMQSVFHHVLPLALPGILTGTIIGLAQALGETAPLLMVGMVAFVVEYPASPFDPSTALPVQIYMWSNSAERAFVERTSAAIMVLLGFLAIMNLTAVLLRRRFERRW